MSHCINVKNISINDRIVPIDSCIVDEIQKLIENGVKTLGCCCGHGRFSPECLIRETSSKICKELGYSVHEYSPQHTCLGIYEIYLKSKCINQCVFQNNNEHNH
jgi:hypothetical protein